MCLQVLAKLLHFPHRYQKMFLNQFQNCFQNHALHLKRNVLRNEYTGLSPIQYIIFLRIAHAKNMLTDSSLSVKQIAFSTGFTDINNFTKQFKRLENITSSAYRKQFS